MVSSSEENASSIESESHHVAYSSVSDVAVETNKNNGVATGSLAVDVLKTEQEFDQIEKEWNELLERADAHVFQTYEWQRIWWEQFGDRYRLHILVFRHNERLVGIVPFFLEETRILGMYRYRRLQLLAGCVPEGESKGTFSGYSPSDYLDMIVDPEYQENVADSLVRYLEEKRDCFDNIKLDELPEEGAMMQSVIPRIKESKLPCELEKTTICPRINLPESIDDYLYMLDGSIRYKLRRAKRPVTDDNLYRVYDTNSEEDFESDFNNLVDLHQKRWNRLGYPGVFVDERFENFLKEVSRAFLHRGWLRLKNAVDHDGNCLAVDLTYAYKKRFYDYQKAFDANSDLAKERPGFALVYFLIKEAIEEKREAFDMMRGGERYKLRLTTTAPSNWRVWIDNSARQKGIKHKLCRGVDIARGVSRRLSRELLILKVHMREWGVSFLPKYIDFLRDRFKKGTEGE